MRTEAVEKLAKKRLVAVIKDFSPDLLLYTVEALIKGGVTAVEVVETGFSPELEHEGARKVQGLKKCFGNELTVGAGNVRTDRMTKLVKSAGADFVSFPDLCRETMERADALSIATVPSAFTTSEFSAASRLGADFVKLFPTKLNGSFDYAAFVAETFPDIKTVAAGNIDFADIAALSKAGIKYFAVGASLTNRVLAEKHEYDIITNEAKRFIDALNKQ